MSTQRKIDSARANGAKSHGPVTEQGRKPPPSTHSFSNDNHAEYDAVLESYIQSLQPIDPFEMDLVVEMVNTKWQQRRVQKFETELFDQDMDQQKEKLDESNESYDETFEQTHVFQRLRPSPELQMLHREASRLKRDHSRALNDLLRLREVRELSVARNKKMKNEPNPNIGHQPPITDHPPPTTVHQPPITNHQSPTAHHQSPITVHQPRTIVVISNSAKAVIAPDQLVPQT